MWTGWIGAGTLGVALYAHHAALGRAHDRLARLEPLAQRAETRDALVGTDIGDGRVVGIDEGERLPLAPASGRRLVWLVQPGECASCLDDLSGWRDLREGPVGTLTVLVGVDRRAAARMREKVDLPGPVGVDPSGRLAESLGVSDEIASVFLVVDSAGAVLMSEARHVASSCDWSFPSQVAAVLNGGDPRRVRGGP